MVLLVLTGSEAWLFWLILLFIFGRIYATPLDTITPMDNRRKAIAVFGLIVFLLTFVPIPFTINTQAPVTLPSSAVWLPETMLISFYLLASALRRGAELSALGHRLHVLWTTFRLRCPNCGQGRIFTGLFRMNKTCPVLRRAL